MESFDSLGGLLAEALNLSAGFDSSDDDFRRPSSPTKPTRLIKNAEDIAALRRELEQEGSTFLHEGDGMLAEESQLFRQRLGKLYRTAGNSATTSNFVSTATSIVGIDESDIESSLMSMGAEELYQQLNDLEAESDRMQSIYSSVRHYHLQPNHSLFIDVESGGSEITVEFILTQSIQSQEVLTLRVFCIPNYAFEEDFVSSRRRRRLVDEDFLPMSFRLTYEGMCSQPDTEHKYNQEDSDSLSSLGKLEKSLGLEVNLFDGEYCLSLTNARQELLAGRYTFHLKIADDNEDPLHAKYARQTQGVQISYQIFPLVKAQVVSSKSAIQDVVHRNETKYYRFVHSQPNKTIVVNVSPVKKMKEEERKDQEGSWHDRQDVSEDFDVNVYLTNQYDGLVPVTKDNAIWMSYETNQHCIEIVPNDLHLVQRSKDDDQYLQTFIIAVVGNHHIDSSSRESHFQLEITLQDPTQHEVMIYNTINEDHQGKGDYQIHPLPSLLAHVLSHHRVDVLASRRSQILVLFRIHSNQPTSSSTPSSQTRKKALKDKFGCIADVVEAYKIPTNRGMAIYGKKTLPFDLYPELDNTVTVYQENEAGEATRKALRKKKYFTVMYVSATCQHPGPNNYQWKVSGEEETCFLIHTNEWKYLSSHVYFSVYIAEIDGMVVLQMYSDALNHVDPIDWIVEQKGILTSQHIADNEFQQLDVIEDCECHLWIEHEEAWMQSQSSKSQLFEEIFAHIDGSKLTYRDREGVDFTSFPFEPLCPQLHHNSHQSHAINLQSTSRLNQSDLSLSPWSNAANTSTVMVTSTGGGVKAVEIDDYSLTYSEIQYDSLLYLLKSVQAMDGEIFYDLGCGVGKALIAAALSGINLLKVVGIEILPSLATCCDEVVQSLLQHHQQQSSHQHHKASSNMNDVLSPLRSPTMERVLFASPAQPAQPQQTGLTSMNDSLIAWLTNPNQTNPQHGDDDNMSLASLLTQSTNCSYQIAHIPDLKDRLKKERISLPIMEVRNENFLQSDWSEADIVFISSMCFSDDLLTALLQQACKLKKGAKLITSKLPEKYEKYFELKESMRLTLSCGLTDFHVLLRNATPRQANASPVK